MPEEYANRKVVISLDFDGCGDVLLFSPQDPRRIALITKLDEFIASSHVSPEHVFLYVGSNRQSLFLEMINMISNEGRACFSTYKQFAHEKRWIFKPRLLADQDRERLSACSRAMRVLATEKAKDFIQEEAKKNRKRKKNRQDDSRLTQEAVHGFLSALYPSHPNPSDCELTEYDSKQQLVSGQLKEIKREHPNTQIDFLFVDDRKDILDAVVKLFDVEKPWPTSFPHKISAAVAQFRHNLEIPVCPPAVVKNSADPQTIEKAVDRFVTDIRKTGHFFTSFSFLVLNLPEFAFAEHLEEAIEAIKQLTDRSEKIKQLEKVVSAYREVRQAKIAIPYLIRRHKHKVSKVGAACALEGFLGRLGSTESVLPLTFEAFEKKSPECKKSLQDGRLKLIYNGIRDVLELNIPAVSNSAESDFPPQCG